MSRDLPLRANLEHLRKQAKERLRELQIRNPQAKLTDAQHDVAREYGFVSWPKLRAHVESLGRSDNFRFNRLTPKARQALFFSRYEAGHCGSVTIEPEHILLGVVRACESWKPGLFEHAGLSLADARAEVAPRMRIRESLPSSVEIPLSDSTRLVLRAASEEADRLVHDHVGIAHVLVGLLHQPECTAASVLIGKGVNLQAVRRDIAVLLRDDLN